MSNIEEYTKNFKFMIPEFNVATWHTEIKENFKAIDALIANFVQSQQYKGAWKQVTQYEIGDLVYINDEDSNNYGGLFKVLVDHITTADDFDTFLGNNPTYYDLQGEMGAQVAALRAQDWAEKTDGIVVINESPVDYSSKAYAIGGVGTETNNSKYFKEQAELARDTILQDPGFIAIKADFLGDENIKTVANNIQHVQNIDTNLQSVIDVSTNIADVNTLVSNVAAILTNATNISSISTNATNISNINNVSSNMSDINNCSNNMAAILDAPNQATSAAQSAQLAQEAALSITGFDLFDHKWSDHLLNDQNWLRTDTFSWQDGTVYTNAYNHLLDDHATATRAQSETIAGIKIYYDLAQDGHKIVPASNTLQVQHVEDIYNATGISWFYILDLENQRFKLPRENPNLEKYTKLTSASVAVKGNNTKINVMTSGGVRDLYIDGHPSGGSGQTCVNAAGAISPLKLSTDPNTSGIVGTANLSDASKTSVYKGKQYLYFYVGQFSQTATEQTAGLNSELFNGKVDLNASNLSTAGKSLISGLGMPSGRYIDLTLGASGTTYTAPANGYFYLSKKIGSVDDGVCGMYGGKLGFIAAPHRNKDSESWAGFLPVIKGDVVTVIYTINGATNLFRFVYAEGEPNV